METKISEFQLRNSFSLMEMRADNCFNCFQTRCFHIIFLYFIHNNYCSTARKQLTFYAFFANKEK